MLRAPRLLVVLAAFASAAASPAPARADAVAEPEPLDVLVKAARADLGARAPTEKALGTFVFAAPPGNEAGLRASVSFAKDVLHALTNGRFRRLPSKPLTVVLFFGREPYERYCKSVLGEACISPYGFFRYDRRAIVMNAAPGLGTLSHELVHPLVEEDFPDAPLWLNEGIASLYEAPALGKPGEIRGVRNWRHPRLAAALRSKTERDKVSLTKLFTLGDDAFRDDDEALHYAAARYLCQWLESRGKLWEFYAKFRDNHASDPRGERAFSEVVGTSPADAQAAWSKWVLSL